MNDTKKTKSIDQTLQESTEAIDLLRENRQADSKKLARHALAVEDRLTSIQDEMDSLSEKMLAYKLRRIADSKMLAAVSSYANDDKAELRTYTAPSPAPTNVEKNKPGKILHHKNAKRSSKSVETYKSTTFQCKSDLDICLLGAKGALDRALCYALFIRCAIKG